VGSRSSVTG